MRIVILSAAKDLVSTKTLFGNEVILRFAQDDNYPQDDKCRQLRMVYSMTKTFSFAERVKHCRHDVAKKLLNICIEKESNLCFSADVTSAKELLSLAKELGPSLAVLKTHIDIITDFTPTLTQELRAIADHHHFLLFEDHKFADIGNTVKQQFAGGIYHIAEWADIINAHAFPGPGIIAGLAAAAALHQQALHTTGLLLIADMSSKGNLFTEHYRQQTLALARDHADFVFGFITQRQLTVDVKTDDRAFIHFTPGVQLNVGNDQLGQQYVTPEKAIMENGADIIIVGRGILHAKDKITAAALYRERGWACLELRNDPSLCSG